MNGLSIRAARFRRPAWIVAGLGLVAGLAFALLTPPLAGYDEPIHFFRAYQVSNGGLVSSHHGKQLGGSFPAQLRTDLSVLLQESVFSRGSHTDFLERLGDPPARGPKTFVDFASGAVYSPVTYLPAATLMRIGQAFGVSTLALVYLGRIGGLLATVALLSLAVRRMPTRAWMLAAVATLPVTVFQAAMLSADGITISLAVLVLAQALDLAATPRGAVSTRKLVEIALATVALGLAKPPYILFALAFAIPWRRHGGRVARALVASVGAGFVAAAAWGAYASSIYIPPKLPSDIVGHVTRFTVFTHVDPGRQRRFVLEHPFGFVATIGRTFGTYWSEILRGSVAQLPWAVSAWVAIAGCVIVAVAAVEPEARTEPLLGWRSRALLAAIALMSFLALMLLAYTGWNAVGAPRIGAFQGRYLLPLLPLVILCLPARQARAPATDRRPIGAFLTVAAAALLTVAWFGLRSHFY